jgi:hypothetical protein
MRTCQSEITSWLENNKLMYQVRDNTGVVTDERFLDMTRRIDPNRIDDEAAFAVNEAKIARSITESARASRKPPVDDPSVIQYEGSPDFRVSARSPIEDRGTVFSLL